jgi:endo-alpha-N-acetylgalactosaminidase
VNTAKAGTATDDVLGGQHSLKLHEEADGTPVRTSASTVNFKPGHKYKVEYSYQASGKDNWSFQVGEDLASGKAWKPSVVQETKLPTTAKTTTREETFTAGCGVNWIGFGKKGGGEGADLVVDDVTFTDLGQDDSAATCEQPELPADPKPGASS